MLCFAAGARWLAAEPADVSVHAGQAEVPARSAGAGGRSGGGQGKNRLLAEGTSTKKKTQTKTRLFTEPVLPGAAPAVESMLILPVALRGRVGARRGELVNDGPRGGPGCGAAVPGPVRVFKADGPCSSDRSARKRRGRLLVERSW